MFISHRLGSCCGADRTLVLDRGCLVEAGTHDDLLVVEARYADLYRLQVARYP